MAKVCYDLVMETNQAKVELTIDPVWVDDRPVKRGDVGVVVGSKHGFLEVLFGEISCLLKTSEVRLIP